MADLGRIDPRPSWATLPGRMIATPSFQELVAKLPFVRRIARRDGQLIFDIVQGFVRSQVLFALVELDLPRRLTGTPASADMLAVSCGLDRDRMALLLRAGAALGLLRRRRDGCYATTRKGAALAGVPGLQAMILHHGAFYRDLGDPLAVLRGELETELADFWPYVLGGAGGDAATTERYSRLMADTQALVAKETIRAIRLSGMSSVLDVGGGSGRFLIELAGHFPQARFELFDLDPVMPEARRRIAEAGLSQRIAVSPGSFRHDPLPKGHDTITLVRVLYDHDDATVADLLAKVHDALPRGGRLIVSEPMSGGDNAPDPITDVYFAFYTLAMRTGRTRSVAEISKMCRAAGFDDIRHVPTYRSYVTSVVTARRAG